MKCKPGAFLAQCLILAVVTLSYPIWAAAAAGEIPVYPGAKMQPISPNVHSVVSRCGHAFTMQKSLAVDADPHAVANWYQTRLPGWRTIDVSRALNDESGGNQMTSIEVFSADGSQTVVINRMHVDPALANASKTLGLDKTDIGVEGISPPLTSGYIALAAQAAAGGASGERAKQQMQASCK